MNEKGYKSLKVYQKAYQLALEVYNITKDFPKEEKYSLNDQIRRSSRSICTNIAEAYRKRRYPKHFVSKLSDANSEQSETMVWIDFAKDFGYITTELAEALADRYEEVGRMIGSMENNPEKFTE